MQTLPGAARPTPAAESKSNAAHRLPLLLGLFSALAVLVCLAVRACSNPLGQDQAWYLYAARLILSGVTPYGPQLLETNPPPILWFSELPVLLARFLAITPALAFQLLVCVLALGSGAWCYRLLRRSAMQARALFPSAFACAATAILLSPAILTYEDFGQREHLFVILALPFLLARIANVQRIPLFERAALGLIAGVAVCLKPQELLVLLSAELFVALSTRTLRRLVAPEILALVLTGTTCATAVRWLTPLYLTQVVPLLINTYWAYGPFSASTLAVQILPLYFAILTTVAVLWLLQRQLRGALIIAGLLTCSVGASLAYEAQHTNWSNHLLPCRTFLLLAIAWLVIEACTALAPSLPRKQPLRLGASVAFALLACLLIPLTAARHTEAPADPLDRYPPGSTVYVFSTTVTHFATINAHHLVWASRFPCLWLLSAILQNEEPQPPRPAVFKSLPQPTLSNLAALQRHSTTEDLRRWRPSIVLVRHCTAENSCQGLEGRNVDLLAWFLHDPDFASVWSHYRQQTSTPAYDVYTRLP
jgi:hypothetical protein